MKFYNENKIFGSILIVITAIISLSSLFSCKKDSSDPTPTVKAPTIGSLYQGGTLFYLLKPGDTGYDPNVPHGLIMANSYSTATYWGCLGISISGAHGTAIGTGKQNTSQIVSNCSELQCAARTCANLSWAGYSDWYLPSKDELTIIFNKRSFLKEIRPNNPGVSLPSNYQYWSSTEIDKDRAWGQEMDYIAQGGGGAYRKGTSVYYGQVIPIRSF